MTSLTTFTEAPAVLAALKKLPAKTKFFSDVVDAEGHQYVDLVMEGGGVLGIGLLGYVYALEQAGLRFMGVGGTSAGAINALLTAAAASPGEPKSEKIIQALADLPMGQFIDGDEDARDFVDTLVNKPKTMRMLWKGAQVIDNLQENLGLNPGEVILQWMKDQLAHFGIHTNKELRERMNKMPPLLRRQSSQPYTREEADPRLAVVAADLTTESKIVFPQMAELYWADPDAVNPAEFARASMSIPGFFHPFRAKKVPQGPEAQAAWQRWTGFRGAIPREAVFVDGGIISNFPIDLFHAPGVPWSPTLGVKLGVDRNEANVIDTPKAMLGAIFNGARHNSDFTFLHRNPDYRNLIAFIDTGKHGWLQFDMPAADKIELFERGVQAAVAFLNGFDWEAYKRVRLSLAEANGVPVSTADRQRVG